jgi:hypothetical protein
MSRTRTLRTVSSLALGTALGVILAASTAMAKDPPELLRLRAFAVNINNALPTNTINIVIERWSTPEEAAKLKAVLVEEGDEKLLSALQKTKPRCGYARTSNSLAWELYFAREIPLPDGGRKIVLATDRPVGMWEARSSGGAGYQFSLAEIRLPREGKGQGKAIRHAHLSFNQEKNTLEIANFENEPVRLNEVTVVGPKKK